MSCSVSPTNDLAPTLADEFRALTLHDVVPAGHIAVPVLHSRWAPHLQPGEFAIVDVSDTEPQLGELYVLAIQDPRHRRGHVLKFVQPCRTGFGEASDDAVMFRFSQRSPGAPGYVDGPLRREHWHRTCRGRVVGILSLDEVEVAHG